MGTEKIRSTSPLISRLNESCVVVWETISFACPSGSQNYMTDFMGDTTLLPPKTELVQGMMMSLMDAIAVYDNSTGAIG